MGLLFAKAFVLNSQRKNQVSFPCPVSILGRRGHFCVYERLSSLIYSSQLCKLRTVVLKKKKELLHFRSMGRREREESVWSQREEG